MAVSDTLIDTLFDGRYRIVRKLGSGGMATVYLAEDEVLGRRVAIKILNERYANDEQFVERFRREAKSAASLSHPNIVSIYDRGEAEGTYYIAMEHLDGRSLKELITARGPAPIRVAIDYARQILTALRFAHRNGIVHRDIKPHNVLVDDEGRLKVTDFGIARAGASQMTEAGSIVGTAQYLSPEQARGSAVDQRSDLYSLGVVLYELLTGTVPFDGDTPVEIAMKHLSQTPDPPSAVRPDIPDELDLVVTRALAKDPEERYQSAEEMDADLERVARGLGVSRRTEEAATAIMSAAAAMPTTIARAPTRVREAPPTGPPVYYDYEEVRSPRRPLWPWLLTILLLVAALVAGWLVYQQIQDQLAETKPVSVPQVEGLRRVEAAEQIRAAGLVPRARFEFSDDVDVGVVIDQDPDSGDLIDRGRIVRLTVSLGRERVQVPNVRGKSSTEAIAALADVGLKANPVEVNSDQPEGTVTAQSPRPGTKLPSGSAVRINVSQGPRTVQVPNIEGQPYESAIATLQGQGFAVARANVESDQPTGMVVGQDPEAGSFAPLGSSVTLSVSKGPKTKAVPSVEGLDRATAVQTIRDAGFKARATLEDTDDESLNGVVLEQRPAGGTRAKPGSIVMLVVGRFVPPADEADEPQETP